METRHRVLVDDARDLAAIEDNAVELVVTSPPYPMIEMWDDLFESLNPAIGEALASGAGKAAFDAMHEALQPVWAELKRVLVEGGIACINIGDATRTLGDSFRVYPNHARIVDAFERLGFEPLPEILWRKPSNSATKFMGSGTLPPNAYVTLEHEYILVFRNGSHRRDFEPKAKRRYEAAYFWEERNTWFSDVWTGLAGELQALDDDELRDRSGAFPFEVPYRLINMYSVYGDTVLDPFWGTGTTSLAAMVAARNSIGYELDEEFLERFDQQAKTAPAFASDVLETRLADHRSFVENAREGGREFKYEASQYDFPVTTKRAREIRLYDIDRIEETDSGYRVVHDPINSK
ncbi:DNA-methyltransferase [Halodesulfurarchaeum sp.]|uniref:DNA-methyltransferase n=1 Tax=Halodesulfurarchaeum sp. TaxID=1980530 RepID=UPI002FC2E29B